MSIFISKIRSLKKCILNKMFQPIIFLEEIVEINGRQYKRVSHALYSTIHLVLTQGKKAENGWQPLPARCKSIIKLIDAACAKSVNDDVKSRGNRLPMRTKQSRNFSQ